MKFQAVGIDYLIQKEHMFLLAVKIMPGAEKVQGEVLLSEDNQLFFTWQGSKKRFFRGKQIVTKLFNGFSIMRTVHYGRCMI